MKINKYLEIVISIIIVYTLFTILNVNCPIKFLTGISCAGCGMTRAWLSVINTDFNSAFNYHPLWILPPIFIIVFLNKNIISPKIYKYFKTLCVLLFIAVYILRLMDTTDKIVTIDINSGLIYKIIDFIRHILLGGG